MQTLLDALQSALTGLSVPVEGDDGRLLSRPDDPESPTQTPDDFTAVQAAIRAKLATFGFDPVPILYVEDRLDAGELFVTAQYGRSAKDRQRESVTVAASIDGGALVTA